MSRHSSVAYIQLRQVKLMDRHIPPILRPPLSTLVAILMLSHFKFGGNVLSENGIDVYDGFLWVNKGDPIIGIEIKASSLWYHTIV